MQGIMKLPPGSPLRPFSSLLSWHHIHASWGPPAPLSSSRSWDHRKALKALPLSAISSENSQHWSVNISGWPGSGPFLLLSSPLPRQEHMGHPSMSRARTLGRQGREGAADSCVSQGGKGPCQSRVALILCATREAGCGWQVKSCQGKYWQEGKPHARVTANSTTPLLEVVPWCCAGQVKPVTDSPPRVRLTR